MTFYMEAIANDATALTRCCATTDAPSASSATRPNASVP